jgi:hypothetical protein
MYPTQESFERAVNQFDEVARRPDMAQPPAAPAHATAQPATEASPSNIGAVASAAQSLQAAASAGSRIVSDHQGLIEMLLFTVPKFDDPASPGTVVDSRTARHIGGVLRRLGNTVEYLMVCAPNQQATLQQLAHGLGVTKVRFIKSPHFSVSIWAQDAYVALSNGNGSIVLSEGVAMPRFEDMSVADDIAAEISEISTLQSYLYFLGGNILGGSDMTLIGRDYVWRNAGRANLNDEQAVVDLYTRELGTPVVVLGNKIDPRHKTLFDRGILSGHGLQPIFHIDMYVTRTGEIRDGKEVVFLGRPAKANAIEHRYSDIPELDHPMFDEFFSDTRSQLEAAGFNVRELPIWMTFGNLRIADNVQKFYNLTWNNAIVQNDGRIKKVLLPNYADEDDVRIFGVDGGVRCRLQQFVIEEWRSLGFQVDLTSGIEDLAWGDGVVHCMTKVLRRTA